MLDRLQRLDLTTAQRARALARLAGTQVELGRCEEALRTADEAEPLARESGADDERVRIEIARGSAWACRGFPFRGLQHNENALALAERLDHKALRASALSLLSTAHQKLGDWSRALDYTQRAFEARENPSDHERFLYHANRGIAFYEFNDRAQAERSFRQALDLARRAGRRRDESWALGELGLVALNFDSDHARALEGAAATEPAVREAALGRTAILHFATHALIDEEHPERSGLALSPGPEGSDGILQTREVYGLDLDAALVTLSACQTALGREATGEGMVAMSRAFFYAGARAVLASLWNVSDRSTAALMTSFYDGIREGRSIDLALAEAKRSFLSGSPEWRHPYYWAPFVVTGHAQAALDFPPRPSRWVWPLALGISGAAVTAMVWRRRTRAAGPA